MSKETCDTLLSDLQLISEDKEFSVPKKFTKKFVCTEESIANGMRTKYKYENHRAHKALKETYVQHLLKHLKSYNRLRIFGFPSEEKFKKEIFFGSHYWFTTTNQNLCNKYNLTPIPPGVLQDLWTQYLAEKQKIDSLYEDKIKSYQERSDSKASGGAKTRRRAKTIRKKNQYQRFRSVLKKRTV
jgi:hypothetical protein